MSAAITHEDVKRVYERFDNARIVQKGAQIEFVTMHFDEKELKELIYMFDMLKAYMNEEENMNDDAISRDAVLDACSQSINILDAMSRIEDLPSVTPIPCDDAISRKAVLNLVRGCNNSLEEPRIFDNHNAGTIFEHYITELPSAEKTGHWEMSGDSMKCSVCGAWVENHAPRNFCGHCGAKMESEKV